MDKIFIFSIVIVIGDELHCLSGIKNYILGKVVACSVSGKNKENKKRSHQASFLTQVHGTGLYHVYGTRPLSYFIYR